MSNNSRLQTLLQISDSAFPTGAFTHSAGCEAADKFGFISSPEKFEGFITCVLENAGSFQLPFVSAANKQHDNLQEIQQLDRICEASTSNHVANRASVRQGKSLVVTSSQVFGHNGLETLQQQLEEEVMIGHQAVMFGCVTAHLGISLHDTLQTYMFGVLRTITGSAVRLGYIGPMQAQRVQYKMQRLIPDIINRNHNRGVEDAAIHFPLVDILQKLHDKLFSKLFYS